MFGSTVGGESEVQVKGESRLVYIDLVMPRQQ